MTRPELDRIRRRGRILNDTLRRRRRMTSAVLAARLTASRIRSGG